MLTKSTKIAFAIEQKRNKVQKQKQKQKQIKKVPKTYWEKNGKYQKIVDYLHKQLDEELARYDTIDEDLEAFRQAACIYWDYYNNGIPNLQLCECEQVQESCVFCIDGNCQGYHQHGYCDHHSYHIDMNDPQTIRDIREEKEDMMHEVVENYICNNPDLAELFPEYDFDWMY